MTNAELTQKLLHEGAQALSDAQLLALLLRTGMAKKTPYETAQTLLEHFGSLQGLLRANAQTFCATPGLSEAKYAHMQAMLEITRRHLKENLQKNHALTTPTAVFNYLKLELKDYPHEVFACLWLDSKHRVIEFDPLFRGSLASANVYPREVVKAALQHNAAAVILAHNHPSGEAKASQADIDMTLTLKSALSLIDVRVLDHVIIGSGNPASLAQLGLI